MEPPTYKRMLVEISKRLRPNELETMKFMLSDYIPKRRMEDIKTALQLFDAMEERELLGTDNFGKLRQLLVDSSEGRTDLVSLLDKARTGTGLTIMSPGSGPRTPTTQLAGKDLSAEFQYLTSNLGKNWKKMCRHLSGIKETDFEAAIECNQRDLEEQTMYILHLWQSRSPTVATREALVNACLKSEMKLHADRLKNLNN